MRYLLVLAKVDADRKRTLGAIATASKLDLAISEKAEASLTWLDGHEPRAVVFDTRIVQAEKLCQKIRAKKKLAGVPLIALVDDTTDAFVERLYGNGADDVIRVESMPGLVTRLKTLPDVTPTEAKRGIAVIADKEHARCDVFGRVLMNAGYDVKFALDDVALKYYTQQSKPRLVVASTEMSPPKPLIEEARKRGCDAVWVITTPRRELVRQVEALDGVERVTVVANSTAPDNVLFMSNELMRAGEPPARADERILYGAVVGFKAAGSELEEMGFTYNISAGGIFVRTLAPPPEDTVWIELRPPRGTHRVRLEGRVAWRRFFDPTSPAAVPPGFGVALTDGLGKGLDEWKERVRHFIQATRLGRKAVAKLLSETLRKSQPDDIGEDVAAIQLVRDSLTDGFDEDAGEAPVLEPEKAPSPQAPTVPAPAVVEPEPEVRVVPPPRRPPPQPEAEPPSTPPELAAALVAPSVEPPAPPDPLATIEPAPPVEEPPEVAEAPPPAETKKSKAPLLVVALVVVLIAGGAAAYAMGLFGGARTKPVASAPPPPPATTPVTTASVEAPASASAEPSEPPAAEAGTPAAGGEAPEAGGEAPAAEAGAALPEVDMGEGGDGSELSWDQGFLVVRSTSTADVYATGFKLGATNKKNKSKCGLKFVRLGTGSDPPKWLTKGKTVDVKCQATTSIDLEPE
jgi:CheY-like chemotaxis protein